MATREGFRFRVALLLAVLSPAFAAETVKNFKLGGALELKPPAFAEPITSVVWKFNKNLVAEWVDGQVDFEYYGTFKGRTTLNSTTGELQIRRMTKADIGVYSVELNYKVQSDYYRAVDQLEVPKPEVAVIPVRCSASFPNCTLRCDGDVKGAEPVTFFWKLGEGEWKESEQEMTIYNKEKTQRVETYTCRMKNVVSEKDSEPQTDPFSLSASSEGGDNVGAIVGPIVAVAAAVVGILLYVFRDKEPLRGYIARLPCIKKTDGDQTGPPGSEEKTGAEGTPLNSAPATSP